MKPVQYSGERHDTRLFEFDFPLNAFFGPELLTFYVYGRFTHGLVEY